MPRRARFIASFITGAAVLVALSNNAPGQFGTAIAATALSTPTLSRAGLITSSAATGGDGGNGWGASKLRIVRSSDGSVHTTYVVPGADSLHKQWVLADLGSAGGRWTTRATGPAGGEPVNLLRGPQDQLEIVSWPNGLPTLWTSTGGAMVSIPGSWPKSDYPYHAAGIDAQGTVFLEQSICDCSAQTPDAPGLYGSGYFTPSDGQWHYSTFGSDYRYTSMFLLPVGSNQLMMAGTRDVLWSELGYTQPAGTFSYVFNDARQWLFDTLGQPPTKSTDVHQEPPTAAYPNVHTSIDDAYVDTAGRTHLLYTVVGASSGGQFTGRHAILQNGIVLKDVPNSIYYPNLSRITQDTTGRFHLISACGSAVYVQSGTAGDTDGTSLGAVQAMPLGSTYACTALNNYITVPRGGTPLADVVDGVFDSGGKWIYYRIQLATPMSCTGDWMSTAPGGSAAPGTPVRLWVQSVGCPNPQYAYWLSPPSGGWQQLQGYSAASSFLWNTSGLANGTYILDIWAKDASSTAGYDTYTALWFTIKATCSSDWMSTTPGGQATHGTKVTLWVQSAGCPNPQYAYWISPPSGGWQLIQTWTAASSHVWDTTGLAPGTYIIDIWARDASSGGGYDTYTYVYFTVN